MNKLKKQAEKAKIFNEKRKELMKLDLMLSVKDLSFFQEKLKKANADYAVAKNELEIFEPDVKQINQSLSFAKQKLDVADKNIESLNNEYSSLLEQINKVEIRKSSLESKLHNDLTSENVEKKAKAYEELISTTKFEIENAKSNIETLKGQIAEYDSMIESLKNKRQELTNESNQKATKLTETRMLIKSIIDQLNNKNNLEIGVKTIIENKNALSGIKGLVKDFLQVDQQYEKAIFTAIGKAANNIIVEEQSDASEAINFLKRNKSGKATFLPISTIKPRMVKPEHIEVLKTLEGFIGVASQLITSQKQYENIYSYLLGNVIIADDLNNASKLSNYTYMLYRVITLDGDVINAGGSMSGGYNKPSVVSTVNLEAKLDELNKTYDELNISLTDIKVELDKVIANYNEISTKQNEKKILLSRHEQSLSMNENQNIKYEMEYQQLVKKNNLADKSKQ
ncbi:MAG: hypothetical protein K2L48_00460 [Mycoplasmoidaceae bacterium]|nr:hypothetical protein [Mycoplasmoidaceae bacterium]